MKPDKHAAHLRMRRETSQDFKLYEAAKMQASRFKKQAEAATRQLDVFLSWPLRDGYLTAKKGGVLDLTQSDESKRGYKIARRK